MSEYKLDNTDINKKDVDELEKGHNTKLDNTTTSGEEQEEKKSSRGRGRSSTRKSDDEEEKVDEVAAGGKGDEAYMIKNLKTAVGTDRRKEDFLDDVVSAISGYFRTGLNDRQKSYLKDFVEKNLLKKLLTLKKLD